ncbi:MFS transporter [Actinomadura nitritigenes]|uniref:MFS transporter n=1 Tax=Actinomadura nitritigenes TaxID=134602 RepID=UPI003D8E66B7
MPATTPSPPPRPTPPSTQAAAPAPAPPAGARFGGVFAVVAAGVAMANLDVFIVNVALPDVGRHFTGASLSSLSWILNAYAVVFAALLVPAGRFADRTGPKRAYLGGIAVFTVASALCAVAPGVWSLVGARAVQAAGAAFLTPSSLALLVAAAPPARRLAAVRGWTAMSGLAAALGPVAGGLLTQLDWRWVFLVNVPAGIAVLLAGPRVIRSPGQGARRVRAARRVRGRAGPGRRAGPGGAPGQGGAPAGRTARPDLAGAGLLTAGIAALALALVKSNDWGWGSGGVIGTLVAAAVLLVLFVHRSARHPEPVLPLRLLRVPGFAPASVANLLFAVAFAAMLLSAVLWCRQVWHWSALRTGLAIAPGPLMVPGLAVGAGPLARRIGAAPIAIAGCAAFAAGIAWWTWAMSPDDGYAAGMLPGMLLTGVGVGLALPTLVGAAVSALPPRDFSTGSGMVTMARQIGTVLGVAMLIAALGSDAAPGGAGAFDDGWRLVLLASLATAAACLAIRRPRPPAGDSAEM